MNYNQDSSSPIKFTPGKDSSYRSTGDLNTRPSGDPKSAKDFKKVLAKNKESGDADPEDALQEVTDEEPQLASLDDSTGKKQTSLSLFDLTKESGIKKNPNAMAKGSVPIDKEMLAPESTDEMRPKPSVSLFASLIPKKAETSDVVDASFAPGNDVANTKVTDSDKFTTRFATEQADLSYINPIAAMTSQPIEGAQVSAAKPTIPATNIQDIINQLVEKVLEMKDNGRTDTVITLKHPPLFAGANIIVTAFDNAKGEFNLSFENLTQAAKNMLDMRVNQQSLLHALEEKGYAVHIVTTTTLMENRPVIAEAQPQRQPDQERQREQDQQGQQGRQQRDKGQS